MFNDTKQAMHPFIEKHRWTITETLPQDGSPRSYTRLEKNGTSALFMDCGPLKGDGYITRLDRYIEIAEWLRSIGIHTPQIFEADITQNIAIIEDFGKTSMKHALLNGADAQTLYFKAHEALQIIQSVQCPLDLESFNGSFMRKARQRFTDWYVPAQQGEKNTDTLTDEYHALWNSIESTLPAPKTGFMHVDYHVENILVLNNGELGIIDFQEGMNGPLAYDVVNLTEDMRHTVPTDIRKSITNAYDTDFQSWMRVLGTQFHMRLLGQCIRWAVVDDKPQYMSFIPHLARYVRDAIDDPVLEPLKKWLEEQNINFDQNHKAHIPKSSNLFSEHAI